MGRKVVHETAEHRAHRLRAGDRQGYDHRSAFGQRRLAAVDLGDGAHRTDDVVRERRYHPLSNKVLGRLVDAHEGGSGHLGALADEQVVAPGRPFVGLLARQVQDLAEDDLQLKRTQQVLHHPKPSGAEVRCQQFLKRAHHSPLVAPDPLHRKERVEQPSPFGQAWGIEILRQEPVLVLRRLRAVAPPRMATPASDE